MKFSRYILSALPLLALASCANDEPATNPDSAAAVVKAEIGALSSRASGTEWNLDDLIGISGTSASTSYSNVPYQTDGSGVFTPFFGFAKGIIYQDANEVTFSAYYPYNKEVTAENTRISASTEQQGEARDFDFLFASGATGSLSNPALNFTGEAAFTHRMAQLVINVTAESDNGFADVDVLSNSLYTLSGLLLKGEFDTATGIATATSTSSEEISLDPALAPIKDRTATHKLILFPQTAAEVELCIEIEGSPYTCTFSPKLEAGKAYTANFTLKRSGLSLGQVSIADWVESEYGPIAGTVRPDKPENIVINGHEAVLMRASVGKYGDPDYVPALYFASCNIGAATPNEAGLYFWWGDVVGHELNDGFDFEYDNPLIITSDVDFGELYTNGVVTSSDAKTAVLTPQYDAAQVKWGYGWRMPTEAELLWLVDDSNCTWDWCEQTDVSPKGMLVTSKSTLNSIFLPVTGHRYSTSLENKNDGYYYSSSPTGYWNAYYLNFDKKPMRKVVDIATYGGNAIRPVHN